MKFLLVAVLLVGCSGSSGTEDASGGSLGSGGSATGGTPTGGAGTGGVQGSGGVGSGGSASGGTVGTGGLGTGGVLASGGAVATGGTEIGTGGMAGAAVSTGGVGSGGVGTGGQAGGGVAGQIETSTGGVGTGGQGSGGTAATGGAPPVCSPDLGAACGTCGGTVRCDGSCSAAAPAPEGTFLTKTYVIEAQPSYPSFKLGGKCGPRLMRSKFYVLVDGGSTSYPAHGTCKANWLNTDTTDCTVFVEVTPGTQVTTKCTVTITDIGVCG